MFSSQLLTDLGWSNHFLGQLTETELDTTLPARLTEVHRDRASALTQDGPRDLNLPGGQSTGDLAVGDWCLFDAETGRILRVLDRKSRLARRAAGEVAREQLIAANVDTAFLTTSCNADFNEARIERYLALIHTGGIEPVILITKSDMTDDPQSFLDRVRSIAPKTVALAVNARDPASASQLSPWTGRGQTVCFLGSSGVGKSTLAVTLTGLNLATGAIREDDAKGRHTTTNRALFRIPDGGWLIDTPGMRELRLSDVSEGIEIDPRHDLRRYAWHRPGGRSGLARMARQGLLHHYSRYAAPAATLAPLLRAGFLLPDVPRTAPEFHLADPARSLALCRPRADHERGGL